MPSPPVRAAHALVGLLRVPRGATLTLPIAMAVIAIVLAGCGSSSEGTASKSPAEILAASRSAAEGASSVDIVDQDSAGGLSLTTHLQLAKSGGRASLSFLGLHYEAIRIGNTVYVKGNPVFYRHLTKKTGVHVPVGTWVKAPVAAGSALASYAGLTDMSRELGLLLGHTGPPTKGATTTVNGQKAIELKDAGKLFTGAIYIAATGEPYPIEIVKHGRETGHITFTAWNDPVTLSAPAGAVQLSNLEHHGGG